MDEHGQDSEKHIADLVTRMTLKERLPNSNDSISFKAHREAESVNDVSYVPILKSTIQKEKSKEKRDALYFILGKLGKNLSSSDIANYLISRINCEENKYTLMFMLNRIAEIPKRDDVDIKPLIQLVNDKRWQVRHPAIQSLNKPRDKAAEDKLIEIVTSDRDDLEVTHANSVLYQIGTSRAIPALENILFVIQHSDKLCSQVSKRHLQK